MTPPVATSPDFFTGTVLGNTFNGSAAHQHCYEQNMVADSQIRLLVQILATLELSNLLQARNLFCLQSGPVELQQNQLTMSIYILRCVDAFTSESCSGQSNLCGLFSRAGSIRNQMLTDQWRESSWHADRMSIAFRCVWTLAKPNIRSHWAQFVKLPKQGLLVWNLDTTTE